MYNSLVSRYDSSSAKLQFALLVVLIVVISCLTGGRQAQAESGYTATVSASSLIIRETPERKGNQLGSLPQGTQINVLREDQFGWAEIEHQSQKGWVAAYYLVKSASTAAPSTDSNNQEEQTPANEAAPETSQEIATGDNGQPTETEAVSDDASVDVQPKAGVVNANGLRLRQQPDLDAKIITLLADSTVIVVHSEEGDWLQVTTPEGEEGWVSKQYVVLESQKAVNDSEPRTPTEPISTSLEGKRIVIDPGHGGKDGGTTGVRHGTLEKDLNLTLSLLLADKLRSHGAEVRLTRDEDIFIELHDRVAEAQQFNADLFISLHHNAGKSTSSGIISFYYSQTKDKPLANALQHELILSTGMVDGGTRFGNYAVLRGNPVPSILLELGFLSNPAEEEKVITSQYQHLAADAITAGIQAYFH